MRPSADDCSGGTDTTVSEGRAQSAAVMSSGNSANRAIAACTNLNGAHCCHADTICRLVANVEPDSAAECLAKILGP